MRLLARPFLHAALLLTCLFAAPTAPGARAEGGPAGPPAQPVDVNLQYGEAYFNQAIYFVARGQRGIPEVRDFYVKLNATLELDATRHQGPMRLWFQAPANYRQELTVDRATTTKILAGNDAWAMTSDGRVQALNLSREGIQSIKQLQEDRDRLTDLTQFLTLQALKGPGVRFRFDGFRSGSGTYEGEWIRVVREAPGKPNITFWLAYTRDAEGRATATWPGIIRVDGDPQAGYPTEDYILRNWDDPQSEARTFRYPRNIEAYSILRGPSGQMQPTRFLAAIVEDIKINASIDPARFRPPSR